MAEFRFFGTWNDYWGILDAILSHREYSLVPDLLYDKSEPVFITTLDDPAKEMLRVKGSGYLWSTKFSRWPPVMKRIEGGEADGKYYVMLGEGGPCLHLVSPACYEEGGVLMLDFGELYYPKWTTAPGTNIAIEPSPELRQGFQEVKTIIKRQVVRLKVSPDLRELVELKVGPGHWSGRQASRMLEEGRARIQGFEPRSP